MKTRCYISRYATHDTLTADLKALVPDPALRRRMSRLVRMGVSTAMECLSGDIGPEAIDAIITATGLGCLADSERFLRNILDQDEELLNPTPFIQSTFNTIGAQVALLCRNHRCNTTYVHRGHSFESALLDAAMQLADGEARHALVGAADEETPSAHRIMERMGLWRRRTGGEGAVFLALSALPDKGAEAILTAIDFPETPLTECEVARRYAADRVLTGDRTGCYPTASARTLTEGIRALGGTVRRVAILNTYLGAQPSILVVECPR